MTMNKLRWAVTEPFSWQLLNHTVSLPDLNISYLHLPLFHESILTKLSHFCMTTNFWQVKGDSAIKLHYTHCRLCSLEKNSGAVPAQQCDPLVLDQPEITALVLQLARFHDIVYDANEQLEACFLVSYLFNLW